jgi:tripartite-type tricarboxylate transporter receptor subunit TctC
MNKSWLPFFILALCPALAPPLHAQDKYPSKPISFIIPFGPGGASDLFWRNLIEELKAELKVPINALNKAGAGGLTGADLVADAKPDGYTLLAANNTAMTVAPAIDAKAFRDLVPIAVLARQSVVVVSRADHPIKSLEELIKRAKEKPNTITVGTTGVTSSTYFDLALLEVASGADFKHVPVPNSSEGIAMALGGHIDFWLSTLATAQNLMKAGRVRAIATCMDQRIPAFPDVPTFKEKGYPDVNLNLSMVLYGPKGIPPAAIKALDEALNAVMKKPQIIAGIEKLNFEIDVQLDSAKLRKNFDDVRGRLEKIAKAKGIKP